MRSATCLPPSVNVAPPHYGNASKWYIPPGPIEEKRPCGIWYISVNIVFCVPWRQTSHLWSTGAANSDISSSLYTLRRPIMGEVLSTGIWGVSRPAWAVGSSYSSGPPAGGTPQILVDKTSPMTGRLRVYIPTIRLFPRSNPKLFLPNGEIAS